MNFQMEKSYYFENILKQDFYIIDPYIQKQLKNIFLRVHVITNFHDIFRSYFVA